MEEQENKKRYMTIAYFGLYIVSLVLVFLLGQTIISTSSARPISQLKNEKKQLEQQLATYQNISGDYVEIKELTNELKGLIAQVGKQRQARIEEKVESKLERFSKLLKRMEQKEAVDTKSIDLLKQQQDLYAKAFKQLLKQQAVLTKIEEVKEGINNDIKDCEAEKSDCESELAAC